MPLATETKKSHRTALAAAFAILAVVLAAGWLLWRRPPALARLLPEADAIVFVDLRPVRLLTHIDAHPVAHSADYQRFIDQTGILPERDLEEAAFALHRMADPGGPNGVVGYSELFSAHFDPERLAGYLRSIATSQDTYAGETIYLIPIGVAPATGAAAQIRTLRVAIVDHSTIAASNMPTAEQIHAMLDRARGSRLLQSGSSLLSATYPDVPAGASVWGVGQLALPFSDGGRVTAFGLSVPIPAQQPMLASLRYTTALHLRLELLAGSDGAASTQANALRALVDVLRAVTLGSTAIPAPPTMAETLRSVTVTPEHDRTLVRATIPTALVRTLASASDGADPAQPAAPDRR